MSSMWNKFCNIQMSSDHQYVMYVFMEQNFRKDYKSGAKVCTTKLYI